MTRKRRPIQRSLIVGSAVFILLLCLLLSAQSYLQFSVALYRLTEARLSDVLGYVETRIDREDLRACIDSGVPSGKFEALQQEFNQIIDAFNLSYLYIYIPSGSGMICVISATGEAEITAGVENTPLLGEVDVYSRAVMDRYWKAWKSEEVSFFQSESEYGTNYSCCRPLKGADGKTFALLCADVFTDELQATVHRYFLINAGITILLGVIFGVLLVSWLRRNVTGPVLDLEKSARRFAEKSHGVSNIHQLSFDVPELRTNNEVASLSEAVAKMTEDIKKHVESVYSAEARAESARIEAEDMSRIAYQDALTHVKNKTAYNVKAKELAAQILSGNTEFAIVMVDVNFLKKVNDTFGHEYGDKYLVGSCEIICDVFDHSPVYRIGGDEFLAVLQGQDYENRETLMAQLKERFRGSVREDLPPWENYSAACGIGVYRPGDSVEQVFQRSDEEMYRNKTEMKGGRE